RAARRTRVSWSVFPARRRGRARGWKASGAGPKHTHDLGPQEEQREPSLPRRDLDPHPGPPLDLASDVVQPIVEGHHVLEPARGGTSLGAQKVAAYAAAVLGREALRETIRVAVPEEHPPGNGGLEQPFHHRFEKFALNG